MLLVCWRLAGFGGGKPLSRVGSKNNFVSTSVLIFDIFVNSNLKSFELYQFCMNIFYYLLGSFIFIVLSILYTVITNNRVTLDTTVLIDYAIRGLLAGLAFFAADYLMAKK